MNPSVEAIVSNYPDSAKAKFLQIRQLIFNLARTNELGAIEETIKWGQPSYLCKFGSTVRLDWCSDNSQCISVFFNCNTKLVETFKEVYGDELVYRGNRVVEISLLTAIPDALEPCIVMALQYHKLKKLPLLGQ